MKHIVFVLGNYYPYYSAVGKCLSNMAEELEHDYKVTIICTKVKLDELDNEKIFNQQIIRVTNKNIVIRKRLEFEINKSSAIKKIFFKMIFNLYRSYVTMKFLLSKESVQKSMVNMYLRALENVEDNIDLIIPTCTPFESILASVEFKKNNNATEIIPFLFDKFSENDNLHRNKLNKKIKFKHNLKLEKKIFEHCGLILYVPSWGEYFNLHAPEYKCITKEVEHPLIRKINYDNEETINLWKKNKNSLQKKDSINIIFAGSLIKNYVEADYFLKMMLACNKKDKINTEFYVSGNASNKIDNYSNIMNVVRKEWITKDELVEKLKSSDILLNIAEKRGKQISSKIFDYMCLGKPIIHIYSSNDDVNITYLKKYRNALLIKDDLDKLYENANILYEWCIENQKTETSYKLVEKQFEIATPKYIANIIREFIDK